MRRGEVWTATLKPRSGSEQRGTRPVVVVSHDGFNANPRWHSIIVVPCSTAKAQTRRGPSAAELPAGAGGLAQASHVLGHQVTTLDRSKLTQRLGLLSPQELAAVEDAVRAAMDL